MATKLRESGDIVRCRVRLHSKGKLIEDKKNRNHDYRCTISNKYRREICDWCDQPRLENPLHFF